ALLIAVVAATASAGPRPEWTFQPNVDPSASPASFLARGGAATVHFEPDGWTLDLRPRVAGEEGEARAVALRFTLEGALPSARVEAGRPTGGVIHSLRGSDATRWTRDVPLLDSVRYREVRPGVDVLFRERD